MIMILVFTFFIHVFDINFVIVILILSCYPKSLRPSYCFRWFTDSRSFKQSILIWEVSGLRIWWILVHHIQLPVLHDDCLLHEPYLSIFLTWSFIAGTTFLRLFSTLLIFVWIASGATWFATLALCLFVVLDTATCFISGRCLLQQKFLLFRFFKHFPHAFLTFPIFAFFIPHFDVSSVLYFVLDFL